VSHVGHVFLITAFVASALVGGEASQEMPSQPGWPVETGDAVVSSPCLADLDGDGGLEAIVGSFDSHVYVLDASGQALPGWPRKTGGPVVASPAVGDLRRDGSLCVVVGSRDGNRW